MIMGWSGGVAPGMTIDVIGSGSEHGCVVQRWVWVYVCDLRVMVCG